MLADSYNISNRLKNRYCHPVNVHGLINDVRHTDETEATQPLVTKPIA